jgi:HD-like signal output (HDOD) protein
LKKDYNRIRNRVLANNELIVEAEEHYLGCTHAHIGHLLAKRWNLPTTVKRVILHHHTPEQAGEYVSPAATIHLADILCRALEIGSGGDERIPLINDKAWAALGLAIGDMQKLMQQVEDEYQDIRPFIQTSIAAASEMVA